jgi:hydrogenase expression/formation protein HypC
MCLGIPVKVTELDAGDETGKVDYLGTKVAVNFALLPGLKTGDWVIIHAGFAISRLDEKEAEETLEMLREIAQLAEA